jgi:hypothetical protein
VMGQSQKKRKKSIWVWESLQLTNMNHTTLQTCKPLNAGWVQTSNLANPQKYSTILKPNQRTPGFMAHKYSPFWDLRLKRSQVQTQWPCRLKFPLAHFPMSLTWVFANGLSGLVCLCCASEKNIGNLKKKPK